MQLLLHGKSDTENGLRDQVLRWKERYDRVYKELEEAEKSLETERKSSTSTDSNFIEKQKRLKELNTYLGLTDVEGSGVIITMQDNPNSKLVTALDLVHDGDLRAIVNEIKNIGAEAISINGQRIVPGSVISCAGAIVKINGETVGAPFVIEVIGNKVLANNLLRPGSFIKKYGEQILIELKESDNIKIKKYNGVLTNKYMKNVE